MFISGTINSLFKYLLEVVVSLVFFEISFCHVFSGFRHSDERFRCAQRVHLQRAYHSPAGRSPEGRLLEEKRPPSAQLAGPVVRPDHRRTLLLQNQRRELRT